MNSKKIRDFKNELLSLDKNERIIVGFFVVAFINIYLLLVYALITFGYILYKKEKFILVNDKADWYLLTFIVISILTPAMYNNLNGFLISLGTSMFLLLFLFIYEHRSTKIFNIIINVISIMSLFAALVGISQFLQYFISNGFEFALSDEPDERVRSVFLNANYYAAVLETVILIALYKLLIVKRYLLSKPFYTIVLVVNLAMLVLTGSRTAWAGIFVAIAFLFLLVGRYKRFMYVVGLEAGLLALLLTNAEIFPRISSIEWFLSDRLEIWSAAIKAIQVHPFFGQGPHTYRLIFKQFMGPSTFHSHSLYIDSVLSYGFVGSALITVFFIKKTGRILIQRRKTQQTALALSVVVAILTHGLFDFTILSPQVATINFGLIFIGMTKNYSKETENEVLEGSV